MRGGKQIGHGGFGDVFDSIDDIGGSKNVNHLINYNPSPTNVDHIMNIKDDIGENIHAFVYKANSHVFKLFPEGKDFWTELENNTFVRNWIMQQDDKKGMNEAQKMEEIKRLTHLHPTVAAISMRTDDFVVYRHMKQGDIQSCFFLTATTTQTSKYVKEFTYEPNKINKDLLDKIIKNALDLLAIIHAQGYLHFDIKLDNFLVEETHKDIVLADYGLLTKMSDIETPVDKHNFMGLVDYMPPFCHYTGIKDPGENYAARMNHIFFGTIDNPKTKHPKLYVQQGGLSDFIAEILESYYYPKTLQSRTKKENLAKIDLHPLGIVILQLLNIAIVEDAVKNQYVGFGKSLMKNEGGIATTSQAIEEFDRVSLSSKQGGQMAVSHVVLGRRRKVYINRGRQYVMYKGQLITLKQAAKIEQKKNVK